MLGGRSSTRKCVRRRGRGAHDLDSRLRVGGGRQRDPRHARERSCSSDSCRYSGRKSWPHCDTQCASSMAKSAIRARREDRGSAGRPAARARRTACPARREQCAPSARDALHPAWIEKRRAHAGCVSAATWSCINAISGDTTIPVPGAPATGSVAQRLAAAGRHQHQRVAPREHVIDDLFLRATKRGVSERLAKDRSRARSRTGGTALREA